MWLRRNLDPVKHLWWSFYAKIVNIEKTRSHFLQKTPSQMLDRVLNTTMSTHDHIHCKRFRGCSSTRCSNPEQSHWNTALESAFTAGHLMFSFNTFHANVSFLYPKSQKTFAFLTFSGRIEMEQRREMENCKITKWLSHAYSKLTVKNQYRVYVTNLEQI